MRTGCATQVRDDIESLARQRLRFSRRHGGGLLARRHAERRRARGLPRLALRRRDVARRRDQRGDAQGCGGRDHPLGGAADRRRLVRGERPRRRSPKPPASSRPASTSRARRACSADALGREAPARRRRQAPRHPAAGAIPISTARGEVVAAVDGAARGRHRRHRLLQLRPSAQRRASTGSRDALQSSETDAWSSRARSSRSPARPAASARRSAAISAAKARRSPRIDKSDAVEDFADELRGDGIDDRARRSSISATRRRWQGASPSCRARSAPVDILINNAGVSRASDPRDAPTPEGWRDDVERQSQRRLLLRPRRAARHEGAKAAAPSSISARSTALRALGDPAYSAAKAGHDQPHPVARAWNIGRYGIRVNIVCPGTVRTPIWDAAHRRAIRRFLSS